MIDTSTNDQMRNPSVKKIQSKIKLLISFLAPTMSSILTRAYLGFGKREKKFFNQLFFPPKIQNAIIVDVFFKKGVLDI